jgi:hypothetical protein
MLSSTRSRYYSYEILQNVKSCDTIDKGNVKRGNITYVFYIIGPLAPLYRLVSRQVGTLVSMYRASTV